MGVTHLTVVIRHSTEPDEGGKGVTWSAPVRSVRWFRASTLKSSVLSRNEQRAYEIAGGDTSVLTRRMAFTSDPDDGRYIDPEVGLSRGRLQIWVDRRNLCAHLDEGERIDWVHWYLLPIIEWFTRHWNPLLHEERRSVETEGDTGWMSLSATRFPPQALEDDESRASEGESAWQGWWIRHALRAAREGGLFPDLVIRRIRDFVEASWGPIRSEGMPYRFDSTESAGFARLPPQAVADG